MIQDRLQHKIAFLKGRLLQPQNLWLLTHGRKDDVDIIIRQVPGLIEFVLGNVKPAIKVLATRGFNFDLAFCAIFIEGKNIIAEGVIFLRDVFYASCEIRFSRLDETFLLQFKYDGFAAITNAFQALLTFFKVDFCSLARCCSSRG